MKKIIFVPVEIETYECGPPVTEQCEDCRFGSENKMPQTQTIDGFRQMRCANHFNANDTRQFQPGVCGFFVKKKF